MSGSSCVTDLMWKAAEDGDDNAKLALADALAEDNQHDLSHAVRWLVRKRRWPKEGDFGWGWTSGHTNDAPRKVTHVLPWPLYDMTRRAGYRSDRRFDSTCRGQIELLSDSLVYIRNLIGATYP